MIELILSITAFVMSLACVAVSWQIATKPPAQRLLNELRGRIEDLEHDTEQLHGRLHKRARQESLGTARESRHVGKDVLAEAHAALAARAAPAASPPEDARAALRRSFNITPTPGGKPQ